MTSDELQALLKQEGIDYGVQEIQHGQQIRCKSGEIFNVYNTGSVVVQGNDQTELAKRIKALASARSERTGDAERPAEVFIVYGHDTHARDQLELILRRMKLNPVILANLPAQGDTIIEKLEKYIDEHRVRFACVLLTPDDEGHIAGKPEEKRYRTRQNVILELGMVLARLGRRRVAILHKKSVELPSDIAGLIYIPYEERVDEVKQRLFSELQAAGLNPHANGLA